MNKTSKTMVAIIDDNQIFRKAARDLIRNFSKDIEIYESASADEFFHSYPHPDPNFVVMDIRMPGMNGFEATQKLLSRSPDTKVLIVSMDDNDEIRRKSIECGAIGNLKKDALYPQLELIMQSLILNNHKI